mmetsp:Transcript_10331/g.15842  ORF Transcript_10331/g.15842 Transcript_10331/m.15842 type:complete len:99 (-) Transcript_10331:26-322(-)
MTGIPAWMSLKCRASTINGRSVMGQGVFGVTGRDERKIINKQINLLQNLGGVLKKHDCYALERNPEFMDLLVRMLAPNPGERISPMDLVAHPFCSPPS